MSILQDAYHCHKRSLTDNNINIQAEKFIGQSAKEDYLKAVDLLGVSLSDAEQPTLSVRALLRLAIVMR